MLMHRRKYKEGRMKLAQKIGMAGSEWDLMSTLFWEQQEVDELLDTQKVVVEYLKEVRLYHRI